MHRGTEMVSRHWGPAETLRGLSAGDLADTQWGPHNITMGWGLHPGAVVKRPLSFRNGDTRFTLRLSRSFGGCSNRKGSVCPHGRTTATDADHVCCHAAA